ncbi:MAG: threonine--tRNA ligase, partial [Clostridiales bacterium]|nr:threonine--tRNA ligase [Clostridiales bacterium]
QIDILLAQEFGMEYVDADGTRKTPYIIHRSSIGCYERTLALLLEKYAGALPSWLMPEQVRVLPITDRTADYADNITKKLRSLGFRAETDRRSEKIGCKIREARNAKIPYMLIVGDKEAESNQVSVRHRADGDLGAVPLDAFIATFRSVVDSKLLK